MPSPKLVEIAQATNVEIANKYIQNGWTLIGITPDCYHVGLYSMPKDVIETDQGDVGIYTAPQSDGDWRYAFAAWIDDLDPAELDRKALEGLSWGDEAGAAAYRRVLKQLLGLEDAPAPIEED